MSKEPCRCTTVKADDADILPPPAAQYKHVSQVMRDRSYWMLHPLVFKETAGRP